jgi:hypothetical protein
MKIVGKASFYLPFQPPVAVSPVCPSLLHTLECFLSLTWYTDAACLCGNAGYKEAVTKKLVDACNSPADLQTFSTFVNDMCKGQPGFPVTIGKSETVSSSTSSGSAVSAAQVPVTSVPPASGTTPRPAVSTGLAGQSTIISLTAIMAFIMVASIGIWYM